jgi:hypothetical protein
MPREGRYALHKGKGRRCLLYLYEVRRIFGIFALRESAKILKKQLTFGRGCVNMYVGGLYAYLRDDRRHVPY